MDEVNDELFNTGSIDEGLDVPSETSTVEIDDKEHGKKARGAKPKFKTHEAEVIFYNKNRLGLNFKNYGVQLFSDKPFNIGDKVKVNYSSDIGNPDFKCWLA